MLYNTLPQNVIPACLPEPVEGLKDKSAERAIPGIFSRMWLLYSRASDRRTLNNIHHEARIVYVKFFQ